MSELVSSFDLAVRTLRNRFVMAPLNRTRAPDDLDNERVAFYYAQRTCVSTTVQLAGTNIARSRTSDR